MDKYENSYEREIELRDLLFHMLYGWRKILIVAVLLTIILGAYRYLNVSKLNTVKEKNNAEDMYQKSLDTYELNKAKLEREINNIEKSITYKEEYIENSQLMMINPMDKQVASLSYYVDAKYHINPELTYQDINLSNMMIRSYYSAIVNGKMYQYILDNLSFDLDESYLKEIITVQLEYDKSMFFINVVHSDSAKCEEIINLVKEFISSTTFKVTEVVGEHDLSIVDASLQTVVDLELVTIQNNNYLELSNLETTLDEKQKVLAELVEPTYLETTTSVILMSAIKYAVVGFVLGAFLMMGILLVSYLMTDKIMDGSDIRKRYNIRILGVVSNKGKKRMFGFVDRGIYKLQGISIDPKNEAIIERITTTLKAYVELDNIHEGRIVLTGSMNVDINQELVKKVSKVFNKSSLELIASDNITYSAETVQKIKESKGVVLCEVIGRTTYTELTKQIEYIKDLDKNILGIILFE